MEYVAQRGTFDDVPIERIAADFAIAYPAWPGKVVAVGDARFERDAEQEAGRA
jgi:hypothetical protein